MRARGRVASYALCFLVIQVKLSNSRTSWLLNVDKVVKGSSGSVAAAAGGSGAGGAPAGLEDDLILDILTGSTSLGNGQGWSRSAGPPYSSTSADKLQVYCSECKSSYVPQER